MKFIFKEMQEVVSIAANHRPYESLYFSKA
jgi:hypothetical protein